MLLHSPGSVLFTKSREQLFLGWKLGCSMINENLISLLFGPQAKRRKRQHMCLSCVQNSLKVTHCLQAKVGTPWLAFKAFLVGPQPEIDHCPHLRKACLGLTGGCSSVVRMGAHGAVSKHLRHAFALPLCSFGIRVGSFDFVYNFRFFFFFSHSC